MAKRFTDSDKWKGSFLRSLQAPYKVFWLYLQDECDHAGIWIVDMEVASLKTGERLKLETALSQFENKIQVFENGAKWFIPDFIHFQYGILNPANRVHESVLTILDKYKLSLESTNKPLISPLQGAKDKVQDKGIGIISEINPEFKEIFERWLQYKKERKESYKTKDSIRLCYEKLLKFSGNNPELAKQIIEDAMSSNYAGFFEPKNKLHTHENNHQDPIEESVDLEALWIKRGGLPGFKTKGDA